MHTRLRRALPALLPLVALALSPTLAAKRLYVDAKAAPGGDGSSWAKAHDDLQAAVTAAIPGDEIWVAEGEYRGSFRLPPAVRLLGGFAPGATRATQADPARHASVLNGMGTSRVLETAPGVVIDGFTVQDGYGTGKGAGGCLIDGGNPVVRRCYFFNNKNGSGRASTLFVVNNANPTVEDCVFFRNGDTTSGHVIDIDGSGGLYANLVVVNNVNNGLHFINGASPRIYNSVFMNNSGRGLCDISPNNTPIVQNNISFGNALGVYHYHGKDYATVAQLNALPYAGNNLSVDPMFFDVVLGDFRLKPGSPAIDAGHPGFGSTGPRDAFGTPRLLDGDLDGQARFDIGVLEWTVLQIELVHPPVAGARLVLKVDGEKGRPVLLLLGANPHSGLDVRPFGRLFMNPPELVIAWGAIPQTLNLPIPASLSGSPLQLQCFAFDFAGHGQLSNAFDVTL